MNKQKRQQTEEELNRSRQHLKNQLTALGVPVLGLGAGLGAVHGSNAFLNNVSQYPAMNTPLGTDLTNKIIDAHLQATGTSYPNIINPSPNMGARVQEGAYFSRGLSKVISKLPKNLIEDLDSKTLGTEGTVIIPPTADVYRLAHELGHRAQDYRPVAGFFQTAGNIAAGLPIGEIATAVVSANAQTNRGAIAKGLLTQYAVHAPRIISEIAANKIGSDYLKSAGVTGTGKTSALQPIGYMLAPAAAAAIPIAAGRLARTAAQKWKASRKKQENQQDQQLIMS